MQDEDFGFAVPKMLPKPPKKRIEEIIIKRKEEKKETEAKRVKDVNVVINEEEWCVEVDTTR